MPLKSSDLSTVFIFLGKETQHSSFCISLASLEPHRSSLTCRVESLEVRKKHTHEAVQPRPSPATLPAGTRASLQEFPSCPLPPINKDRALYGDTTYMTGNLVLRTYFALSPLLEGQCVLLCEVSALVSLHALVQLCSCRSNTHSCLLPHNFWVLVRAW